MFTKEKDISNGVQLAHIRVRRVRDGVDVTVQSAVLEEWAKSRADRTLDGEARRYRDYGTDRPLYQVTLPETAPYLYFGSLTDGLLSGAGKPVMTWICLVGLKEGITYHVPGVYSRELVSRYLAAARDAVRKLYQDHICQYDTSVDIIARWRMGEVSHAVGE